MKYTSKLFVLPGGTVVATDEEGGTNSGVVEQANSDGAMFTRFPDQEHLQLVWGPAPKPAPVTPAAAGKKNAELQAEVKRLQGIVDDQAARIAELEAAAKAAPVAGAEDDGKGHFG